MLHRIEHAQHLASPAAAARLASLGLNIVINPQHLLTDFAMGSHTLGAARVAAGKAFAYGTLLAAGASTAAGSDWPVVDVDPFQSVYATAYRSWPPEQVKQAAAAAAGVGAEPGSDAALAADQASSCSSASVPGCVAALPAAPASDITDALINKSVDSEDVRPTMAPGMASSALPAGQPSAALAASADISNSMVPSTVIAIASSAVASGAASASAVADVASVEVAAAVQCTLDHIKVARDHTAISCDRSTANPTVAATTASQGAAIAASSSDAACMASPQACINTSLGLGIPAQQQADTDLPVRTTTPLQQNYQQQDASDMIKGAADQPSISQGAASSAASPEDAIKPRDGITSDKNNLITTPSAAMPAGTTASPTPSAAPTAAGLPSGLDVPGFVASERVPVDAALHLHTSDAARVAGMERLVGRLAPGLRADFIVLDSSPLLQQGGRLPRVVKTYVDGECVYDSEQGVQELVV